MRSSLSQESLHSPQYFSSAAPITEDILVAGSLEPDVSGSRMRAKFQIPRSLFRYGRRDRSKLSVYFALRATDEADNVGQVSNMAYVHFGFVKLIFDNIIIGTNSRPFETTVIQSHVSLPNPVLFYHNRILLQRQRTQIYVRIPKELGRNTKFTITSDQIELLDIQVLSPNGTFYGLTSDNYVSQPSEMVANIHIALATPGIPRASLLMFAH